MTAFAALIRHGASSEAVTPQFRWHDTVLECYRAPGHALVCFRSVLDVRACWLETRVISGSRATALKALGDPELDDGLAGNSQPAGFPVEGFDHP